MTTLTEGRLHEETRQDALLDVGVVHGVAHGSAHEVTPLGGHDFDELLSNAVRLVQGSEVQV